MKIIARRVLPVVTLIATVAAFAVLVLPALGAPQRSGLEVRGFSLAHMHRGGSGYGSEGCREQLAKIREMGGNWVSVTEFAWMRAVDQPDLRYAKADRPMGESAGIGQTIKDARAAGLKVLVKPHVWSGDFGRGGKWAADIAMKSEEDWAKWFEQYTAFIVQHASAYVPPHFALGALVLMMHADLGATFKARAEVAMEGEDVVGSEEAREGAGEGQCVVD